MGKMIFNVCKKLHDAGLLPWFLWSPIYDRLHRCGKKWERS